MTVSASKEKRSPRARPAPSAKIAKADKFAKNPLGPTIAEIKLSGLSLHQIAAEGTTRIILTPQRGGWKGDRG